MLSVLPSDIRSQRLQLNYHFLQHSEIALEQHTNNMAVTGIVVNRRQTGSRGSPLHGAQGSCWTFSCQFGTCRIKKIWAGGERTHSPAQIFFIHRLVCHFPAMVASE